ncbi:MAG: ribonuclease P protein component [Alphaproteobacteria bacterium]|nr:ribonuclease P protein component [Alphaproteobacteria bacterium]
MPEILKIKKRKDFLRVAKGIKVVTKTLILQAAQSLCNEEILPKIGYTTSKKIGKATVRNRTRRRLRAAVQEIFPNKALSNVEYVLVGRYNTATCDFALIKENLNFALKRANKELGIKNEENK